MVLGAGGSERIYRAVAAVISNVLDFGMDLAHAVDAERFFAFQDELGPYIWVETNRIAPEVVAELQRYGHYLDADFGEYGFFHIAAGLQAAGVDLRTRERLGVVDPRSLDGFAAAGQIRCPASQENCPSK